MRLPGISPQSVIRFSHWLTFTVSVIGLPGILVIAPWQCRAEMGAWSGGKQMCSLDTGWYFFLAVFVVCVGFSGYRVYRMRRDEASSDRK